MTGQPLQHEDRAASNVPYLAVWLAVAYLISFVVVGIALWLSHSQACSSRRVALNVVRDILVDAQKTAARSAGSATAKAAAAQFYMIEFQRIASAESC